jgi:hypothetical protein
MKNSAVSIVGNVEDAEYDAYLARVNARFVGNAAGPLFTTDVDGLWDAYLTSFDDAHRQHHNCHACRHFIERWAGLVTIDERGLVKARSQGQGHGCLPVIAAGAREQGHRDLAASRRDDAKRILSRDAERRPSNGREARRLHQH